MIELERFNTRTDLASEEVVKEKYEYNLGHFEIVKSVVNQDEAEIINKKPGLYYSMYTKAIIDEKKDVLRELPKDISVILGEVLDYLKIDKQASCLIIGLGNDKITPDALGPKVVEKVLVTKHIHELEGLSDGLRVVSAMAPGVMGVTGLETSEIVKAVVDKTNPDFVVVVDALASSSLTRINQTIQISTAGINPGSGVGNSRKEISEAVLNVPVISIGIPTVVDVVSITNDTISLLLRHLYSQGKNPKNRLVIMEKNDLSEINVPYNEQKAFLGLVGTLKEDEIRKIIFEAIAPNGYNFIVTPKGIDLSINNMANIISRAINITLHDSVN